MYKRLMKFLQDKAGKALYINITVELFVILALALVTAESI